MGFYGNITNTIKTNLQFDKKYCNRFEMEANCATDGVYSGRYVLVEYDLSWSNNGLTNDVYTIIYTGKRNGRDVFSTAKDLSIDLTPWVDVIYRAVEVQNIDDDISILTNKYYIGIANNENNYDLIMEAQNTTQNQLNYIYNQYQANEITQAEYERQKSALYSAYANQLNLWGGSDLKLSSSSDSNYVTNFNVDTNYYGDGRGWDSTVWMKTYDNSGLAKYVMVAELNSVVPTFAISVDAPTEIPQAPHFDETGTNTFYTIHMQPQWGLRVKEAKGNKAQDQVSDVTGSRIDYTYDEDNQVIKEDPRTNVPFNIYYNAAGFNPDLQSKSFVGDKISLEEGSSGKYYNDPSHQPGLPVVGGQSDIYELSIVLPSIGNAISDMWDIVYDVEESGYRKRDIAWKDAVNSDESTLSFNVDTLAGTINAAHKLMGMIVTSYSNKEELYNNNYIYNNGNKYQRVVREPSYTLLNGEPDKDTNYYILENGQYKFANPNIPNKDYYYISGFEYKFIDLPEFGTGITTINGALLKIAQMLDLNNEDSVDINTVQGCINKLNAIIDVFNDLKPNEFVIVNDDGQAISASWTTAQQLSYTNKYDDSTTNVDAKKVEDRWIKMEINPTSRLITLIHQLAYPVQGKNETIDYNQDEITIDDFDLYTPIVDNAGHVVGHNIENVTLPTSIRSFRTNGQSEKIEDLIVGEEPTSYTAETIKDVFNIDPKNKWIKTKIDGDSLSIAHLVNSIDTTTPSINMNTEVDENGKQLSTLSLFTSDYDEAGHIISTNTTTYILPYQYSSIQTVGSTENSADLVVKSDDGSNTDILPTVSKSQALVNYDSISINPSNKWLQIKIDNNNVQLAHLTNKGNTVKTETNNFSTLTTLPIITALNYDEAGHIIEKEITNYSLPAFYSNFQINQGENSVSILPAKTYDTLVMKNDPWILVQYDSVSQQLLFKHNIAQQEEITNSVNPSNSNSITPGFGQSFKVPTFSYDSKGHIYSPSTYEIKMPAPTHAHDGEGNVIINSSMSNEGVFTFTKGYIGDLQVSTTLTDTLNTILTNTSTLVSNNKTTLETLTGSGDGSISKMISNAISGITGGEEAPTVTDLSTQVENNKKAIEVLNGTEDGSVSKTVSDAISAVTDGDTTTIKALNEALSGKVDSNKPYTIISTDGTVTLEGDLESILQKLLDRTITTSTETT